MDTVNEPPQMPDLRPGTSPATAPSSTPTANDSGGAPTNDVAAQLAEKIERASAGAVDQHLSGKRKRGQRGPDKGPRKPRVPVEQMANGADPTFLAQDAPTPLEPVVEVPPTFDEETARTLVEIGVGLLNDGAAAIVRAVAKKETNDEKLADEAAASIRMSEKIESCVKKGAVECARKYAVRLDYAPEMMLCGGLIIWGGQVSLSVRALKAKGAELRANKEGNK